MPEHPDYRPVFPANQPGAYDLQPVSPAQIGSLQLNPHSETKLSVVLANGERLTSNPGLALIFNLGSPDSAMTTDRYFGLEKIQ